MREYVRASVACGERCTYISGSTLPDVVHTTVDSAITIDMLQIESVATVARALRPLLADLLTSCHDQRRNLSVPRMKRDGGPAQLLPTDGAGRICASRAHPATPIATFTYLFLTAHFLHGHSARDVCGRVCE